MSYVNAEEVLPEDLIREIQKLIEAGGLVEYTKKIVYEKFSFSLECEIIFVDNKL